MTQAEAIQALDKGCKITHRYFSPDEYVYMKDGTLRDENDNHTHSFWMYRTGPAWQDGWSLYKGKEVGNGAK